MLHCGIDCRVGVAQDNAYTYPRVAKKDNNKYKYKLMVELGMIVQTRAL